MASLSPQTKNVENGSNSEESFGNSGILTNYFECGASVVQMTESVSAVSDDLEVKCDPIVIEPVKEETGISEIDGNYLHGGLAGHVKIKQEVADPEFFEKPFTPAHQTAATLTQQCQVILKPVVLGERTFNVAVKYEDLGCQIMSPEYGALDNLENVTGPTTPPPSGDKSYKSYLKDRNVHYKKLNDEGIAHAW